MQRKDYGTIPGGGKVEQFTLRNREGMEVKVITYGGRITDLKVPDRNGESENVVLGFDSLEQYRNDNSFFGALIGRYANGISQGKFSLGGKEYQLAQNDGANHIHGGEKGFDKVLWKVEGFDGNSGFLKLCYTSEDMEEGYPGNLQTKITYILNEDNSFDVRYEATTTKTTIINLTQHSYFNLSGDFSKDILDHIVEINADKILPVDKTLIPTGELKEVENSPFDFRRPTKVGDNIEVENEQLKKGQGFDHCFVLNDQENGTRFAASALHPTSGRYMEVFTDEPGLHFYTGNFLNGTLPQRQRKGTYVRRSGFCFEAQHYPDSPNQKQFPPVVLHPGEKYKANTVFKFSVK